MGSIRGALVSAEGARALPGCLSRGSEVARSFLESDLVDEVVLFRSPRTLGGKIVPALAGLPLSTIEGSDRFQRIERRRFGADMMSRYERVR